MKLIKWWKNHNFFFYDSSIKKKIFSEFNVKKNYTRKLEEKLSKILNKKYVIFTTSGSSALILALNSLNLKKKNILIPNRTWVATGHAAYNLKYSIKLADVNKGTMNLDIEAKNQLILKNINILLSVNINGKNADLKKLNKKNLIIIEDCAQSFLSNRNKEDKRIIISCYSTGSTKIMNTFQGGFCATNNKKHYKKILLSRNHGVYDLFSDKWNMPGFNLKPTNFQCFIGLQELKKIRMKKRNCIKIFNKYVSEVKNLKVKIFNPFYDKKEFPLYVFAIVKNKNLFISYMKKNKIQVRPLPPSLSSANYFFEKQKKIKATNSNFFYKNMVYLPCGPSQTASDITRVIKAINSY